MRRQRAWSLFAVALAGVGTAGMAAKTTATELRAVAYHDVRAAAAWGDDPYAVSASHLAQHFQWLRQQGYTVVRLEDVVAARNGGPPLPDKAVLLSFDDGFRSAYTQVFPLLKLFGYPAVVSIVTDWIETRETVPYDERTLSAADFLTWDQIREMQQSGLVEIASHTHALHAGIVGNPFGNLQPATATRHYADGAYENDAAFMLRIEDDLGRSIHLIRERTGRVPRTITWPYGAWNELARQSAARLGMPVSLALGHAPICVDAGLVIGRELAIDDPGVGDFAAMFAARPRQAPIRAVVFDLDAVHDSDVIVQEERLGRALDAIEALAVTHVLLRAYADDDDDGRADALYFPNRKLPMRSDLFNRAAWQLATRCGVRVLATLPLNGYTAPWSDGGPATSRAIAHIYEDLASHASFHGVYFEQVTDTSAAAGEDELNALSLELAATVRRYRPEAITARTLPIDLRTSPADLQTTLDGYLNLYDYATVVARPAPASPDGAERFCTQVVPTLAARPGGLQRTILALPGTAGERPGDGLAQLAACGVRHFAWHDHAPPEVAPAIAQRRRFMSATDRPGRP